MKARKVLLLGSGALMIGQAGEFDYSGTQALKALKEEKVRTILVNPNVATIQTSKGFADEVYFLPVTPEFVTEVIKKEKPDAVMLAFGGQTALNCGVELQRKGVLKKYGVEVLGTPVDSIMLTEDRQLFAQHLRKIGIPTPTSRTAKTEAEAVEIAQEMGFPLMIRAAYALGGLNSGVVRDMRQLKSKVGEALAFSPQVLVEQYLHHFKEIEYEVVRDRADNCVTVCNMENFDPLGIHTGESIVVAPSQTLNNLEYQKLRSESIRLVRSLGIVGECNVQFALNPRPQNGGIDYQVIEVNARLSRSSALASKATGYPLAYVATKLALGKVLTEIPNQVTKVTQSCFEPAMDYLVVKMPRWDLEKFEQVSNEIGSSMKSVGEVMAIGRNFEEAIQKAVRMINQGFDGVTELKLREDVGKPNCLDPTPKRLMAVVKALGEGVSVAEVNRLTGIDPWFLSRLEKIVEMEKRMVGKKLSEIKMRQLKELGFSDRRIGEMTTKSEMEVRGLRKKWGVRPRILAIDTLAGEFPAVTNYLYMSYLADHDDVDSVGKNGVVVLGSGPYRIGSSVEFDWTSVNTVMALKKQDKETIMINCNPETVSTDYDVADRLYFEELTQERVLDIYEFEQPGGVVVSVGGQIPNNLVGRLDKSGVKILGTRAVNIDMAEDRAKFSQLLDKLEVVQPEWGSFSRVSEANKFAERVGYPVLVRPSYVLSGDAMSVCFREEELARVMIKAVKVMKGQAVTVTKYFEEASEIEFDGVAQDGQIMCFVISEHLEYAGVHSGDATVMYPTQKLYVRTDQLIKQAARKLVRELAITGPFNIQFLAKNQQVYVIEANLRSSRTFPFVSKATGVNLAELSVEAFFGRANKIKLSYPENVAVKVPQFSFARLSGADPMLKVEMASTGEAAGFGRDKEEAFLKAELAVGGVIPVKGVFISLGGDRNKVKFLESAGWLNNLDLPLYATEKTAMFLKRNGIKVKRLYKVHEKKSPNVVDCFQKGLVDLAINIVDRDVRKEVNDDYVIRRAAVDFNVYLLTERNRARLYVKALALKKFTDLAVLPWRDYV